jgi:catechol 2,3-dioxygenase-like lactoylglutathione lyase family enzyme
MSSRITALDHVQLAMPPGEEETADAFYRGVLGFDVLGGRWYDSGGVQLHLGVEADFRPARKAHPALRVADLDGLVADLGTAGIAWTPDSELPGVHRGYVDDPFGNRIELIDSASASQAARAL